MWRLPGLSKQAQSNHLKREEPVPPTVRGSCDYRRMGGERQLWKQRLAVEVEEGAKHQELSPLKAGGWGNGCAHKASRKECHPADILVSAQWGPSGFQPTEL